MSESLLKQNGLQYNSTVPCFTFALFYSFMPYITDYFNMVYQIATNRVSSEMDPTPHHTMLSGYLDDCLFIHAILSAASTGNGIWTSGIVQCFS